RHAGDRRQAARFQHGARRSRAGRRAVRGDRRVAPEHGRPMARAHGAGVPAAERAALAALMDTRVEQTAASSVVAPVDPLDAQVQAAQEEIEQAITRAGLLRDPYRHPLRALVTVLGVFPALVRRLDRLLDRAQNPLDD